MSLLHPLIRQVGLAAMVVALPLFAADVKAQPVPPKTAVKPKSQVLQDLMAGANWEFKPASEDRRDPFYDRERVLLVEGKKSKAGTGTAIDQDPGKNLREYAQAQLTLVERLVADRKFEEAIRTADTAIRKLDPESANPGISEALIRLRGYREQANDAMIRNEAQAAFDGLGLKVLGIFWADGASRRCIVSGEKQSRQVNDRVKDCVIINIETDRVDFRFHYKSRRFEFPRYVGEDAKSAAR